MPCKALILVGGFGTRLRPLTFDVPKPLVPFANKAIVMHQIEALQKVGVTEVILAVSYQSDIMADYLEEKAKQLGILITISKEDEPLGTAGPLSLARDHLAGPDPFFVLNSDVCCDYPFQDLLDFHRAHGKEGTIFVTQVTDPSKYGVVVADDNGRIEAFVEKPKEFVGDKINAGMYVFNAGILDRIKPVPTSIEREIFPAMASEGNLYRYVLRGFWMDIGQPLDYLTGQVMYLDSVAAKNAKILSSGPHILGSVLIHPTATIGKNCKIGPHVVIGENVRIGNGVRIERSAVFKDTKVGDSALIRSSIIGWEGNIGAWARLTNNCVLGKDVTVSPEVSLNGVRVCPHKAVKTDELTCTNIL